MSDESWFPNTLWFDNLDVLGSEAYQATSGLHYEASLDSSQVWELFGRVATSDLPQLVRWAIDYEAKGLRFAAQAVRDRAAAVTAFLDPGLSETQIAMVQWYLQFETRPPMLRAVARWYESQGFALVGNAIRDRYALLRIARRRARREPDVVWPWPAGMHSLSP